MWVRKKSETQSVVLIGDPFKDGGVERNTLYGVKLFTMEEEKAVDLAVISPPEQQRLKQFLNLLIKWYKLNSKEIQELHAKYVVPDDVSLSPPSHAQGTDEDGGDEHEPHGAFDPTCEVEHHARQQQYDPLELLRHQIIEDHARCHEPDEGKRGKRHLSSACSR